MTAPGRSAKNATTAPTGMLTKKIQCHLSLGFIFVGLILFSLTPIDGTYLTDIMPAMVLIGLGAGLGFPALMMLAMSGATMEDSGLASGLVNTSVQVGGAIGLAVLATFASERTDDLLANGESAAAALNSGYHLAYLIGAGVTVVAAIVAVTVIRSPKPAEAQAGAAPDERPEDVGRTREPAYADA